MGKTEVKYGAIYGRVSVDEAAEIEHGSLEQQVNLGTEMADGLTLSTGTKHIVKFTLIEERGVSGKDTNRPKYQELISLIESQQISFVIAKEISRISRSTLDFCNFLDLCKKNDVAVHIRGMPIDPHSPMGEMFFKQFATMAEFERRQIVERTKSSIRSAMKNNAKIHGGPVPLGFDKDPNKKGAWLKNRKEIDQVKIIMQKFNEHLCYKSLLIELNEMGFKNKTGKEFNVPSLKRLLTNKKYIGKLRVPTDSDKEEIYVDLPFGAVIEKELFDKTQESVAVVEKLRGFNKKRSRVYALTGVLHFEDGSRFTGNSGTARNGEPKYYYYNAKNKIRVSADEIEGAVFNSLRIFEDDEKMIEHARKVKKETFSKLDFVKREISKRRKELKEISKEEESLLETLRTAGGGKSGQRVLRWLDEQLEGLEERKRLTKEAIASLKGEQLDLSEAKVDANSLKKSLKVVFDRLEASDPEVKRGIARQLFKSVKLCLGNRLEVSWNLPLSRGSGGKYSSNKKKWGG
jgi:DNA invertase Pin-like site-specific DNA recombinase